MNSTLPNISKYFEELRVILGVVDKTKKEVDRLIAPDFNLFNIFLLDEIRLSNMIANLLDPSSKHGQGNKFLNEFLEMIKQTLANNNVPLQQFDSIKYALLSSINLKVLLEQPTSLISSFQRRMDIVISDKDYGLMIENKPWAIDQNEQLQAYNQDLEKRYPAGYMMIYLSRSGSPPSEKSLSPEHRHTFEKQGKFIVLGYRPHLENWLHRCLFVAEAEKVRSVLKDFLAFIESSFPLFEGEAS